VTEDTEVRLEAEPLPPEPRSTSRPLWSPNDWPDEPTELPPGAFLTNDPELMELRSRPVTEREARDEVESQQDNGAFG